MCKIYKKWVKNSFKVDKLGLVIIVNGSLWVENYC